MLQQQLMVSTKHSSTVHVLTSGHWYEHSTCALLACQGALNTSTWSSQAAAAMLLAAAPELLPPPGADAALVLTAIMCSGVMPPVRSWQQATSCELSVLVTLISPSLQKKPESQLIVVLPMACLACILPYCTSAG
jgi:hypothetical protein